MIEKLIEIQSKLKAPKSQRNTFGNYNYRSAEDILNAVKPFLKEQELALLISDRVIQIGDRIYIEATVTLQDTDTNKLECTAVAREQPSKKGMDDMQLTGATSSYARKYALNGLFAIDDTKDSDSTNDHGQQPQPNPKPKTKPKPPAKASKEAIAEIQHLLSQFINGKEKEKSILDWYKLSNISQVNKKQAYQIIGKLSTNIEERKAKYEEGKG